MIIKNLLNKLEINIFTIFMIFICTITGLFKEVIAIFILIFFHELGHYLSAVFFKWNVKKIVFYPFGGLTVFDEIIDKPLIEEFIITIMGPLFQIIIYFFIYILYKNYYVSEYFFLLIKKYHYGILILNLLPIIPLDGSKIMSIVFNKILCFKNAYILNIVVSILVIFFFFYYIKYDTSYYLLITFLVYQISKKIIYRKYIYQKFILERKLYKFDYKKLKKINTIKNMHRNKRHIIKKNNTYITEKRYLK